MILTGTLKYWKETLFAVVDFRVRFRINLLGVETDFAAKGLRITAYSIACSECKG